MAETINVSTYELLVKPIIDSPEPPNRTVIQGYFLTIANPSFSNLEIHLSFQARTPDFNSSTVAAFWDVNGTNNELVSTSIFPCLRTYKFNLPPLDTGLFLLLPDIREDEVIAGNNTEIRGYVRLSISSASTLPSDDNMRTLLITAEQRGTFLPQNNFIRPLRSDFDHLSYSLPLANGGSEVTLEVNNITSTSPLTLPPRQAIFDAIEKDPNLLSSVSSDQFSQQISKLNIDEQRQMLNILLERFDVQQQ